MFFQVTVTLGWLGAVAVVPLITFYAARLEVAGPRLCWTHNCWMRVRKDSNFHVICVLTRTAT